MRKGDLKKQEILKTAESRFCRFGYETTSIQDILDDLRTSKGSFYHHFESKETLLEEICKSRAKSHSDSVIEKAGKETDPLKKINILFSGIIPFSGEKLSFLMMILPVFSLSEGIHIRNCYERELTALYSSSVASALEDGNHQGLFSCRIPDFYACISIQIINRLWFEISDLVISNESAGIKTEPADLLQLADQYRMVLERILSAPYGSIDLVQLTDLQAVIEQIHIHWKKKEQG